MTLILALKWLWGENDEAVLITTDTQATTPFGIQYEVTRQIENQYATWESEYDFTFIERFTDEDAFNSHCNEQYVIEFFDWIGKELIEDYNVRVFTNGEV